MYFTKKRLAENMDLSPVNGYAVTTTGQKHGTKDHDSLTPPKASHEIVPNK
jgi:hypothetical protein